MRPTTQNLFRAPFGDFPYVKRLLPILRARLGIAEADSTNDDKLSLCFHAILLETRDHATDADILQKTTWRYSDWQYMSLEQLIAIYAELEDDARSCSKIPIYGSTSEEAELYWKNNQYGLTPEELVNESLTSIEGAPPTTPPQTANNWWNIIESHTISESNGF